ncbi:MAG TPA: LPXTG cell wall anchor domain-containing protein [Yinghuangia sp.]|nr:LPXTG cell wall anchor domain-containing protein [Yinghuangia sp.]
MALPVLATGTAYATGDKCDKAHIKYSLDGGKTWTDDGRMDHALVTKIQVKVEGKVKDGCDYAVSLASYDAEGPTWATSGKQTFLGWSTAKLNKQHETATLEVPAPKCFGQVDLYGNGKKYDGKENPLPLYPHAKFPTDLITAWNGGKACQPPTDEGTKTPPPSGSPSTSKPPTDEGTKTPPPSGSPSTSKPPTDEGTKTPPPSGSPSTSKPADDKTPPPTTTAPAPGGGDTTPPTGSPEVPPVSEVASASLAETGGNDNGAIMIGVAAGALLIGGAGVLVWNRRRNAGGTPA